MLAALAWNMSLGGTREESAQLATMQEEIQRDDRTQEGTVQPGSAQSTQGAGHAHGVWLSRAGNVRANGLTKLVLGEFRYRAACCHLVVV